MRQKIIIFISIFFLVLIQIAFIPHFFSPGSAPNMVLILVVFFSFRMRLGQMWKLIVTAGILLDVFLFLPWGTHLLAFLLVSLGVKILERKFFIIHSAWRFFVLIVLVALCTWMYESILPFLLYVAKNKSILGYQMKEIGKELGFLILYNVTLFAILYRLLQKTEYFFTLYSQRVQPKRHVG